MNAEHIREIRNDETLRKRKVYRPSLTRLAAYASVSIVIAGIAAIGKSRPIEVFSSVASVFLVLVALAWANTGIFFENGDLVKTTFFVRRPSRSLNSIKKVRIESDEDSFGARTVALIVELPNARPICFSNFDNAQMREIVEIIRAERPSVIDTSVQRYFEDALDRHRKPIPRRGDITLIVGGLSVVAILIVWQLLNNPL